MIGVDEVGRGSWAGPMLVVAAREKIPIHKLKDSKKLTKKQRLKLYEQIILCYDIGEGWVTSYEIDKHGLTQATKLGVKRALKALKANNSEDIIIDGNVDYSVAGYINIKHEIKADDKYGAVSAASIAAKVIRDNYMVTASRVFPNYGFEKNVGYGTNLHMLALGKYGACKIHRRSYKPVKAHLDV